MKVLVCGGRNFNDPITLGSWLGGVHKQRGISLLIEGGAPGADFMARKFAEWQAIPVRTFEADWKRHGRAAGPIRNKQMLEEGKPDLVVAFPGGRGTANMVEQARAAGVEVLEAVTILPTSKP
jgi:UDP-N-acetylmuramoylalanine-D-glutamate ligase